MKMYDQCDNRTETVARATAYHWAGRRWAEANSVVLKTEPHSGSYSRAEFIAVCGLIAEACSYLHDDAEGDIDAVDLVMYPEHLQAAVEYAAQGLHCPRDLAGPGLAFLERDEGYAGVIRDAILRRFSRLVHVAELDLSDCPMDLDHALEWLNIPAPRWS